MAYKVDFTQGNNSVLLTETNDRKKAADVAVEKQKELKVANEKGIISLYELTTERGSLMRKCLEFWEV